MTAPLPVADDDAALARHAQLRGQRALVDGDGITAMRWLDRAHRLAPHGTFTLALATACLRHDNVRAEALFRAVAEAEDVRAAWLGLAAARLQLGDAQAAAGALANALARHVPEAGLLAPGASLADAIAHKADAAGWCGLTLDGNLVVRPAISGRAEIRLDGRHCAGSALPRSWTLAGELTVSIAGRHLLGSPIQLVAIRRVAGFVEAHEGGLRGWAWHPSDPDRDPVLLIRGDDGRRALPITATDRSASVQHAVSLARPRGFSIAAGALAGFSRPLHISGSDGADVLGSPLDPTAEQDAAGAAAAALAAYLTHQSARQPTHSNLPRPARALPLRAASTLTPETARSLTLQPAQNPPPRPVRITPSQPARKLRDKPAADASCQQAPRETRLPEFPPPAIPADIAAPRLVTGPAPRRRQVDVVIPVCGKTATVLACLDSVLATVGAPHGIIVIDDASPEHALRLALDTLAADGRIRLVRHVRNRGFPASANDGIAVAPRRDVILLNSDTLVPPGWLERLRDAAYMAAEIGTATPLSNEASILSYPGPTGSNPVPDRAATVRLDGIARRANPGSVVDIPVGVGFCMYLRRDCIDEVGPFRADIFAQGYGEENDFCLRARRLGWRHVAVPGVFVAHLGGASFGQAGRHLQARNLKLLNRLHPGYDRLINAFVRADPLAEARRRFDRARWRAEGRGKADSVIFITHDDGGGVERQVGVAVAGCRAAGLRPVVLRPARRSDGPAQDPNGTAQEPGDIEQEFGDWVRQPGSTAQQIAGSGQKTAAIGQNTAGSGRRNGGSARKPVSRPQEPGDPTHNPATSVHNKNDLTRKLSGPGMVVVDGAAGFPNLRYALPQEMPALLRLLRATSPRRVEVHHTLHHPPEIYDLLTRLDLPYDVHIHDYVWFCPQVSLVGGDRRYCGEPAVVRCEACVADAGQVIDETIGVQALRDRSTAFLGAARRIIVPSADAAARMRRHFLSLRPELVPLEDDAAVPDPPPAQARSGLCRVCIVGAIGVHKGYDIVLGCARDAAERGLPIEFVVVGHTMDDARLLTTERVFVTGRFAREEAVPLIRAQEASLALLPSVWPETWNFGLTELWRAGLNVAAFDFGAPAERIGRTGRGFLLPLGLPPRGINNALVAAVGLTGHEGARTVDHTLHLPSIQETSKHPWQERRNRRPSECSLRPPRS